MDNHVTCADCGAAVLATKAGKSDDGWHCPPCDNARINTARETGWPLSGVGSSSTHTPGPWRVEGADIRCEPDEHDTGTFVAEMQSSRGPAETRANAARIVACVNALEGVACPAEFVRKTRQALTWNLEVFLEMREQAEGPNPSDWTCIDATRAALAAFSAGE